MLSNFNHRAAFAVLLNLSVSSGREAHKTIHEVIVARYVFVSVCNNYSRY
jgi:hypothetical protein